MFCSIFTEAVFPVIKSGISERCVSERESSDVSGVFPLCHCRNITKWSFQLAALLHHHQVTKKHLSSRLWRNICGSETGSDLVAGEFYACAQMRLHFGARLNWCTYAPWLVSDSHYASMTGDKQAPPPLRNLFLLSQLASCWNVSDPLRFHLAFITWGLISSDVFIQSEQQKLPGVKVFKRVSFLHICCRFILLGGQSCSAQLLASEP